MPTLLLDLSISENLLVLCFPSTYDKPANVEIGILMLHIFSLSQKKNKTRSRNFIVGLFVLWGTVMKSGKCNGEKPKVYSEKSADNQSLRK